MIIALCSAVGARDAVGPGDVAEGRCAGPDSIAVHGLARDTVLAILDGPSGQALRADVVLPLIGGRLKVTGVGRWTVEVPGASLDLVDGVPFATSNGETIPLTAPPSIRAGALMVPLQLFTDIAPRIGNNVTWDADRRELRVFRPVARATPPARMSPAARAGPSSVRSSTPVRDRPVASSPSPPPPSASSKRRFTIVVDAGHGGPDAGMRGPIGGGPPIREKDITLAVARLVAQDLENRGVEVVMTRTTDTLIALGDRGRIANQHRADLFVSIHVHAANPSWKNPGAARGFETYFLAEAKTEDERRVARMENEVTRFDAGPAGTPEDGLGFLLNDMKQNEYLRESSDLAATIQAGLGRMHPGPSRGVKQAGFAVLVGSFMPSVLVEIGFGTNPTEAAWMSSQSGQRAIAAAVAGAAMEYVARYERRVGTGDAERGSHQ